MRAAIVGCGDVSAVHFDALADMPGVACVAVCDRDAESLQRAMALHGLPGFADHRAMFASVQPDVVHICTPHNEHAQIAIDALAAGIDVLLEKPIASSIAEGDAIIAAARESSARSGICFQNRYNPTSIALHDAIQSGAYGAVLGARAQVMWTRTPAYYQAKPWRGTWHGSGGGLLMNQAVHTVDLVQWLLGDVVNVRGEIATLMFDDVIEVEDTAAFVLHHASGVRTNFFATLTHFTDTPVLIEVVCEDATLRLEGDLRATRSDGTVEVLAQADVARTSRNYWGASHVRLINDFYAGTGSFWIDAEEAMRSLRIVKAVYADHQRKASS